ncbi:MAG: hypothetical protein Q8M07_16605, partial [Prosthecobacter sp.]|nr:hypothetical protein [Prosthecobacter sp.]
FSVEGKIGPKLLGLSIGGALFFALYVFTHWFWRLISRLAIKYRCRAVDNAADEAMRSWAVYELALRATAAPFLHDEVFQKIQIAGQNRSASDDFRTFCSEAIAQIKANSGDHRNQE